MSAKILAKTKKPAIYAKSVQKFRQAPSLIQPTQLTPQAPPQVMATQTIPTIPTTIDPIIDPIVMNVYKTSTLLSDGDMYTMVDACKSAIKIAAATWNYNAPTINYIKGSPTNIATNLTFVIVDTISDELMNVAGHIYAEDIQNNAHRDDTKWKFYIDNTTETCSASLFHVLLETLINPFGSQFAHDYNTKQFNAIEVCNPVESNIFTVNIPLKDNNNNIIKNSHKQTMMQNVGLSNFIYPSWINASNPKYDYMGILQAPFQIAPHGYKVLLDGNGNGTGNDVVFVFGVDYDAERQRTKQQTNRVVRKVKSAKVMVTNNSL